MHRRIDFHGKLDGRTELGDGSVRFTARLTRTGVFDYGDHKELRLPEDVFADQALSSFRGLAVTDGHAAWIDTANWQQHAKGHVGDDVHQDGDFVVASVVIKDAGLLAKIDAGDRAEVSMGYSVDLESRSGKTDSGEEYDAIQKNIRGNHAALGPKNWGRAGGSVKLLDGVTYAPGVMTEKRIDAPANDNKDLEAARSDAASARADADALRKERDTARADLASEKKRADTFEAERDAAKRSLDEMKVALEAQQKSEAARIDARIALLDSARVVLGKDFDAKGKSDREVQIAALQKIDSKVSFDGKSDDYVQAAFDIATKRAVSDGKELANVNETTTNPAPKKSILDAAYEKADAEARQAAQAGPPAGAKVRR